MRYIQFNISLTSLEDLVPDSPNRHIVNHPLYRINFHLQHSVYEDSIVYENSTNKNSKKNFF